MLYGVNRNAEVSTINVTEGVLGHILTGRGNVTELGPDGTAVTTNVTFNYFRAGNSDATGLFEFLAKNSSVEWSQVKFGTNFNYISTSHQEKGDAGAEALTIDVMEDGRFSVSEINHSHPYSVALMDLNLTGPSGFSPDDKNTAAGTGDKAIAQDLYRRYPNSSITFGVYDVSLGVYWQYNRNTSQQIPN